MSPTSTPDGRGAGDVFEWHSWRFEVVDMDGHRIDKVLASRMAGDEAAEETAV